MTASDIMGRIGEARYNYSTDTFHWDDLELVMAAEFARQVIPRAVTIIGLIVDHARAKNHKLSTGINITVEGQDFHWTCPEDGFKAIG